VIYEKYYESNRIDLTEYLVYSKTTAETIDKTVNKQIRKQMQSAINMTKTEGMAV
jgi:hypothetical protein